MALSTRLYLVPFVQTGRGARVGRRPRYAELSSQIAADGGAYDHAEVNGIDCTGPGWVLARIRAEATTHAALAALPGVRAIPPQVKLGTSLGELSAGQRAALRGWVNDCGYSDEEIEAHLPADWRSVTLRALVKFMARRNAPAIYQDGAWTFGRLPRKRIADLEARVPDPEDEPAQLGP